MKQSHKHIRRAEEWKKSAGDLCQQGLGNLPGRGQSLPWTWGGSTSSIWLLEHVCCRLPRAGRCLLPFRIAMARECPRCVPCGSSLGHEGSQDEAHKKRHASLNAPHLLLFPGPLSKHSGCQERPIRHPCSASRHPRNAQGPFLCSRSSMLYIILLVLLHGRWQDVLVRTRCWNPSSSRLSGGLNEILCKWCLAQSLARGMWHGPDHYVLLVPALVS